MADLLTKICIISSIIGIILLVLVSNKLDIPSSNISSIDKADLNKQVKIKGYIKKITNKESLSILEIEDKTSSITVVMFKPEKISLEKNSFVEIYGKVSVYNEQLQIIAELVSKLN